MNQKISMYLQMLFRFQVLTDNTNKLHFVCDSAKHLLVLYTKIFSVLYSCNIDFSCEFILSVLYWLVTSMYMPVQKKVDVHVIMTLRFFNFSLLCNKYFFFFFLVLVNFHDKTSNFIIFHFIKFFFDNTNTCICKKHKGILNTLVLSNQKRYILNTRVIYD